MEFQVVQPVNQPAQITTHTLYLTDLIHETWQMGPTVLWNILGIYLIIGILELIISIFGIITIYLLGSLLYLFLLPLPLILVVLCLAFFCIGFLLISVWIWGNIAYLQYLNNPDHSIKEILVTTRKRAKVLIPTYIMFWLTLYGGVMLFVIPGIISFFSLSLTMIVAIIEDKTLWEAMGRSRELTSGRLWNLFFIYLGNYILMGLVLMVTDNRLGFLIYPLDVVFNFIIYKRLSASPPRPSTRITWHYKLMAVIGVLSIFTLMLLGSLSVIPAILAEAPDERLKISDVGQKLGKLF